MKPNVVRKRRFAAIRSRSLYLVRYILGNDLSADQAIQNVTWLVRLARRAK
jgi:hypothetical protein